MSALWQLTSRVTKASLSDKEQHAAEAKRATEAPKEVAAQKTTDSYNGSPEG